MVTKLQGYIIQKLWGFYVQFGEAYSPATAARTLEASAS